MRAAVDTREETSPSSSTLWTRLRDTFWRGERVGEEGRAMAEPATPPVATCTDISPTAHAAAGKLLQFPIRGEALLVRLADLLRSQVDDRDLDRDSLQLTMSRRPITRLSIDDTAYVEFNAETASYYVEVTASPDTRLTLQSSDFDTIVNFVVQYVRGCYAEPASLVAAP
jgi:hypothetical protein